MFNLPPNVSLELGAYSTAALLGIEWGEIKTGGKKSLCGKPSEPSNFF